MLSESAVKNWQITTEKHRVIYAHCSLGEPVSSAWFDASYWMTKNAVTGESKGRNTTYFINYKPGSDTQEQQHFVLRHYYRGGLVNKVLHDEFLYTGLNNTRCIAELTMLQKMVDLQLPVPKPIAAMVTKVSGVWCRNDILIGRIDDAQDGYHWLLTQELLEQTWRTIGATIRRFHDQGVYHSDLNIHNIMIDKNGSVYLIDFDRCEFRKPDTKWQQANLSRLLRSLEKEKNKAPQFYFNEQHWQQLLLGYHQ